MTDPNQNTAQPAWLRVLNNQRFQVLLQNGIKVSGFAALPFVQKWFPGVTPDSLTADVVAWAPFVAGFGIDWWRNHPDNILARAVKVINGGKASPAAVAKVTEAAK